MWCASLQCTWFWQAPSNYLQRAEDDRTPGRLYKLHQPTLRTRLNMGTQLQDVVLRGDVELLPVHLKVELRQVVEVRAVRSITYG